MRRLLFMIAICLLTFGSSYAQEDTHLKILTEGLLQLRKTKSSNEVLNKKVIDWSASGCPKLTLMDEIQRDPDNEYKGNGANQFKMNQLVTHVYHRQNIGMVSKGDYFNSTEKDIYYSAIEKNIKKGCSVTYTLNGHVGEQEFVFVSYHANTNYTAKVNELQAKAEQDKQGVLSVKLPPVKKGDKILITITNNSNSNESFVILNHNPQK